MEENKIPTYSFMSAEINEVSAALSAFQGEVEQPTLNRENPYFKSRYVDLSGVLKATQPVLAKNGLSVTQIIDGGDIITLLSHKSGQWFKSVCPIGSYKSQQDRGSAITYTKRYAICAILGIAADTDDDANMDCGNEAEIKDRKVKTTAQVAFTSAQLQQAIDEVNAVTDEQGLQQVWNKWAQHCPAICNIGTDFYKAGCDKRQSLRTNKAK